MLIVMPKIPKISVGSQMERSLSVRSDRSIRDQNINLLLTEREGRTGEYWPEVVAVRTERSEVRTETTEGQYSPVRLELARLVSSLLYGIRAMLVLNLPAFENKKYTAYDRFHGNGPYGEIPTKKEPIRTLGFALPYNNVEVVHFDKSDRSDQNLPSHFDKPVYCPTSLQ